jgi:hypothetical protein
VARGEVIDGQQKDAKVSTGEKEVNGAKELKDGNNIYIYLFKLFKDKLL